MELKDILSAVASFAQWAALALLGIAVWLFKAQREEVKGQSGKLDKVLECLHEVKEAQAVNRTKLDHVERDLTEFKDETRRQMAELRATMSKYDTLTRSRFHTLANNLQALLMCFVRLDPNHDPPSMDPLPDDPT